MNRSSMMSPTTTTLLSAKLRIRFSKVFIVFSYGTESLSLRERVPEGRVRADMPQTFVVPALTRRFAPPSPEGRGTHPSAMALICCRYSAKHRIQYIVLRNRCRRARIEFSLVEKLSKHRRDQF